MDEDFPGGGWGWGRVGLFLGGSGQRGGERRVRFSDANREETPKVTDSGINEDLESDKEMEEESKRESVCLVDGFKGTLSVNNLIGSLPESGARLPANRQRIYRTRAIGDIPVHSISFNDLDLKGFEKIIKSNTGGKANIRPLRTYLIGKQKGTNNENSAITVLAGLNKSDQVQFFLKLDEELVEKLKDNLTDASISAALQVKWYKTERGDLVRMISFREGGVVDQHQHGCTDRDRAYHYKSNHDHLSYMAAVDLEMIRVDNSHQFLYCVGTEGITKDGLNHYGVKTRKLEFNWEINLEFEKYPEAREPFKLDSDCVLLNMYDLSDASKDVSIVAKNGAEVKCHRNILMAQSASFNSMLCPERDMMEGRTGRIDMPENSEDGLRLFVKLLYGFEVVEDRLTADLAIELFQLSHKYEVKGLEEFFIEFLIRKGMDFYTPDAILELYFSVRNVESLEVLRAHALTEMSQLKEETLRSCDYFKRLSSDEAISLVFKLLEWK